METIEKCKERSYLIRTKRLKMYQFEKSGKGERVKISPRGKETHFLQSTSLVIL